MINILLVEDHPIVRNGLKLLLESDPKIKVTHQVDNGQMAITLLNETDDIDLVLTDLNMPLLNGIQLTQVLKETGSKAKVMLLSMHGDKGHVYKSFEAGASAYLIKEISKEELLFSVHHVMRGGRYVCASITMDIIDGKLNVDPSQRAKSHKVEFSTREQQILRFIAQGMTNQAISDQLSISKRTIEGHRKTMIIKCEVQNTAQLVYYAMQSGDIH
jgi:two-component system response regulator NreC